VSLISGGRYDELIGHFGPEQPAVGWALTLDQVLVARELQGVRQPEPVPDVLLSVTGHPEGLAWASQARARGLRVEVDLAGLKPEDLWRSAQTRGIRRAVWPDGADRLLVREPEGERQAASDAWEEFATWLR